MMCSRPARTRSAPSVPSAEALGYWQALLWSLKSLLQATSGVPTLEGEKPRRPPALSYLGLSA
jgi:hypothetical protein